MKKNAALKVVICKKCNITFQVKDTKRNINRQFCSSFCAKSSNGKLNKGRKHSNRVTPLITIICLQCKNNFEVKYKQRNRKFCCRNCSDKFYSGDKNPSKRPEVREKIGKRVSETHWDSSGKNNPMFNKGYKLRGNKNGAWKGGISFGEYGENFSKELKTQIRKRDNFVCKICGKNGFIIHHIDYDKKNNEENNLINLCRSCHAKTGFNRKYWVNYLKGKELCQSQKLV